MFAVCWTSESSLNCSAPVTRSGRGRSRLLVTSCSVDSIRKREALRVVKALLLVCLNTMLVVGGGQGVAGLAPIPSLTPRPTRRAVSFGLTADCGAPAITIVDLSEDGTPTVSSPSSSVGPEGLLVKPRGTPRVLSVGGAYDWNVLWKSWGLIAQGQRVHVCEFSITGSIGRVWNIALNGIGAGQNVRCALVLDESVLVVATGDSLMVSLLPEEPSLETKDLLRPSFEGILSVDVLVRGECDGDGLCRELFAIGKRDSVCALFRMRIGSDGGLKTTKVGAVRDAKESVPMAYVSAGGAALDPNASVLLIAWSDGRVSWVSTTTAVCVRNCAKLPEIAGAPCAIRLAPSLSRFYITTRQETGDLQVWILLAPSASSSCSVSQCVESMDPRGLAVLCEHPRGSGRLSEFDGLSANTFIVCSHEKGATTLSASNSGAQLSTSGLQQLERMQLRLDTRLRSGIAALVEANLVVSEKEHILRHARQMLYHVTGNTTAPSASRIFQEELEPVPTGKDGRHRRVRRTRFVPNSRQSLPTRDPGALLPALVAGDDNLVHSVTAEHFLDSSCSYLCFAVDSTVSCAEPCLIWLEVQLGEVLGLIWDALEFETGRGRGKRCCLVTRVLLSDLISCSASGLSDLRAEARVVSASGRVQLLGSFTIAPPVFNLARTREPPKWCSKSMSLFAERMNIIGRGADSQFLERSKLRKDAISSSISSLSLDRVSRISVETSGGVHLVTAAARVLECAADGVSLEIASLAPPLVATADSCVSRVNNELEGARETGRNRCLTGNRFASLLCRQAEADEEFGAFEEMFVGVTLPELVVASV